MKNKPSFALYSIVEPLYKSEEFFNRNNKVTSEALDLLQNPVPIRRMGWNLDTLDYAKIVNGGEAWEVNNGKRKKIRIYRDGSILITAAIDNNFLGWGKNDEQFKESPEINNLALTEFTYEAVRFVKNLYVIYKYETGLVKFTYGMENSAGLILSNQHYSYLFREDGKILEKDFKEKLEVDIPSLKNKPEELAYKIMKEIYTKFNIEVTHLPYTLDQRIDVESIKKIG
jgi:hypothetical protein